VIDLTYLVELGPQAIPALDRYIFTSAAPKPAYFQQRRDQIAATHLKNNLDWRAWTYRRWRLTRYLEESKRAQP